MKRPLIYLGTLVGVVLLGTTAWAMTARAGYESAEYTVVETDGSIEIRDYPDLLLVATNSKMDTQGRDGSFMRLFRYISGANAEEQKIAMTTPVFMEGQMDKPNVTMGFVVPKKIAADGAPAPTGEGVTLQTRKAGRFAAIRFPGRLDSKSAQEHEAKLRSWLKERGLEGSEAVEAAGYDAPYIPAMFRRNEVLIRLNDPAKDPAKDTANEPLDSNK